MSFVIFGDSFTFPEGNAATNRVHSYAKGFTELGVKVYVICFLNQYLDEKSGEYQGIKFYRPFEQRSRSNSIIVRTWHKFMKYINTIKILREIHKNDKIIAINCWSSLFLTVYFGFFLSRIFKSKLVVECSEHPLRYFQVGFLNKIKGNVGFFFETRMNDGVLCISNYLINFYKSWGVSERKLILLPSTVDPARFSNKVDLNIPYKYIGYFGSLSFERDNIDLLLRAYSQIYLQHPGIRLVFGGFGTDSEINELQSLISELGLGEHVSVITNLNRNEVVQYILNAHILVMVRNTNLESEASYPSKLTEYLSTSIPVVTVNVGEVSNYLVDKETAFLVEPGNVGLLATQLSYVLNNYEFAKEVGKRGKALTDTVFNYRTQSERILAFIKTLS